MIVVNSAAAQKLLLKQSIYFKPGNYAVTPSDIPTLDSIKLLSHRSISIRIEGNADSIGSRETNMTLSQSRSAGVRIMLVVNDIPAEIITIDAFGSTKPIATNNTKAGRRLNRRVDILVYENETITKDKSSQRR
jgi:outer membrane protein OmpA-like peptidoglycan-associated protein